MSGNELFPVLAGACWGVLLARLKPASHLPLGAPICAALGLCASWISGELYLSWAFVAIDFALVVLAAAAGMLAAQWLRRAREHIVVGKRPLV